MTGELETRAVFVDTSVFRSQNFAFRGDRFTRLRDLCRAGKLRLVLTDVTVWETEARITEEVNKAARALRGVGREANVLKPLDIPGLAEVFSKTFNKAAYRESLIAGLQAFLGAAGCEIVSAANVPAGPILDLYFGKKPPFGEGKKKDEFPDAFALATLEAWCARADEKIYVVSEDGDMRRACEGNASFIHLDDLSKLLELALRDEGLATREAHERFALVSSEVREGVRTAFEDGLFMLLEDHDGEAVRVEVTGMHLGDESVTSLSDEEANFALRADVAVEADITYPDPDSVFRDSDTGDYLYLGSIETTVDRALEVPVEVSVRFDPTDPRTNEVTRVTVNNDDYLWIRAEEDEFPYK